MRSAQAVPSSSRHHVEVDGIGDAVGEPGWTKQRRHPRTYITARSDELGSTDARRSPSWRRAGSEGPMSSAYHVSPYAACLTLLNAPWLSEGLALTLAALANPIGESCRRANEASTSSDPDYVEAMTDMHCEIIEEVLGAAFVCCQTLINRHCASVERIHSIPQPGITLTTTSAKRKDVLAYGTPWRSSPYTAVQILNGIANYWKHHAEWPADWKSTDRAQKATIDIVRSAGLKPSSSGNLRRGAAFLDNPDYHDVQRFHVFVHEWSRQLHDSYETELKTRGLL